MSTAADQLIEEGIAIGIVRGEARGEANAILLVLQTRFDQVPKSTRDTVQAITDLDVLEQLTVMATKCKSLEEFNKALK